jgi:hypothetical protein
MIAKLIAIKYPRVNSERKYSDLITIDDATLIKSTIMEYLFINNYDYILINYTNNLYICEKSGENIYSRTDKIIYHPLMDKLQ